MMKRKTKGRRGRPPRAEASAKALASLDLATINPREVLLTIAADTSAPATARVMACRALLAGSGKGVTPADNDPLTELALKLLKRGKS